MPQHPNSREPTPAESIFADWLTARSRDFESLARATPAHTRELRSLHALWLRIEPLLALADITSGDAVQKLMRGVEANPEAPTPVRIRSESARKTATEDLLSRLGSKRGGSRYRLEGEVARGGMGEILRVWDEDLRRHLAMKVVLGQSSATSETPPVAEHILARFLEEAQITGQLEHPSIVPVHELGLDSEGRVYFTMKLVKGRHLASVYELVHSGAESWTETRALGVLLKACEAVAYAHSKGVIHRDLKPQNVMVGDFGEVYVMDWGLARVLSPSHEAASSTSSSSVRTERLAERESSPASYFMTMDGEVIGTPAYMSPEQARGDIDALSARSDVYALGAMLYHLLAGFAPYMAPGAETGGREVWQRALAGPPEPLETSAPLAPSELVAIQSKAMARDPADRYADVLALQEDLRAFLEGRVVGAFETGALAEARKWIRRNRGLAASLGAMVLALVAGLVTSLVLADRVRENALLAEDRRVEAEASASDARRQARIAGEVNAFLNEDLLAAVAPEREGIDVTVREVLDAASTRLDGRFEADPEVEAALRTTIGSSYSKLGQNEAARRQLERALELRRSTDGPDAVATLTTMGAVANVWGELGRLDESIPLARSAIEGLERVNGHEHRVTLTATVDLAVNLVRDGQFEAARTLYDSILARADRVFPEDDELLLGTRNNVAILDRGQGRFDEASETLRVVYELRLNRDGPRHPETLTAMGNLALVLFDQGRRSECESMAEAAVELHRAVFGPDHQNTGRMLSILGNVILRSGRAEEAEAILAEVLEITRRARGDDTQETQQARTNLAAAMLALGRLEESIALQADSLSVQRRVLTPDHPTTLETLGALATMMLQVRRFAEAEALLREARDAQERTLGPDHPSTIITNENLGNALRSLGRTAETAEILRAVLDARRRALGDAHPDVAKTLYNLGLVTMELGDLDAARALLEEAQRRARDLGANAEPGLLPASLGSLGELAARAKDYPAAINAYREALAEHRGRVAVDDTRTGHFLHQLALNLFAIDDAAGAVAAAEEALPIRRASSGTDEFMTLSTLRLLGRSLLRLGRWGESEAALLEAHAGVLRARGADHADTQRARESLVELYIAWGKSEEAANWR